jgi:hypothetical protein
MKTMTVALFLFLVSLIISVSASYTYEWIDDEGIQHFTDDSSTIPERYQSDMRKREVKPDLPTVPSQGYSTPSSVGIDSSAVATAWRRRLEYLTREISVLQEGLETKRKSLAELERRKTLFHKSSDRIAFNQLAADVEQDEKKLADLELQLKEHELEGERSGLR